MYLLNDKLRFTGKTMLQNLLSHSTTLLVEGHVLQQLQEGQHGVARRGRLRARQ
jgi:hypothetical protein